MKIDSMDHGNKMSRNTDLSHAQPDALVTAHPARMWFAFRFAEAVTAIRWIVAASLLLAAGTCCAAESRMQMLDKQQFVAWDALIRADFAKPAHDQNLSPADEGTVKTTLAKMEGIWQKADAGHKLADGDLIELANDQQIVSTILDHAPPDSRIVCERLVPTGTRVALTLCRSIAQSRHDEEVARNALRYASQTGGN
jgi:hypothetical protein